MIPTVSSPGLFLPSLSCCIVHPFQNTEENIMRTTLYSSYRRDLGDGLVLRWSTAEDTERIATLLGRVHRKKADEPPNASAMRTIRGMMNGDYPLMGPDDFGL